MRSIYMSEKLKHLEKFYANVQKPKQITKADYGVRQTAEHNQREERFLKARSDMKRDSLNIVRRNVDATHILEHMTPVMNGGGMLTSQAGWKSRNDMIRKRLQTLSTIYTQATQGNAYNPTEQVADSSVFEKLKDEFTKLTISLRNNNYGKENVTAALNIFNTLQTSGFNLDETQIDQLQRLVSVLLTDIMDDETVKDIQDYKDRSVYDAIMDIMKLVKKVLEALKNNSRRNLTDRKNMQDGIRREFESKVLGEGNVKKQFNRVMTNLEEGKLKYDEKFQKLKDNKMKKFDIPGKEEDMPTIYDAMVQQDDAELYERAAETYPYYEDSENAYNNLVMEYTNAVEREWQDYRDDYKARKDATIEDLKSKFDAKLYDVKTRKDAELTSMNTLHQAKLRAVDSDATLTDAEKRATKKGIREQHAKDKKDLTKTFKDREKEIRDEFTTDKQIAEIAFDEEYEKNNERKAVNLENIQNIDSVAQARTRSQELKDQIATVLEPTGMSVDKFIGRMRSTDADTTKALTGRGKRRTVGYTEDTEHKDEVIERESKSVDDEVVDPIVYLDTNVDLKKIDEESYEILGSTASTGDDRVMIGTLKKEGRKWKVIDRDGNNYSLTSMTNAIKENGLGKTFGEMLGRKATDFRASKPKDVAVMFGFILTMMASRDYS